jgi:hypothetical protein
VAHPAPDVEPYPSEIPALKGAMEKLNKRFQNKVFDEDTMMQFMQAAREIFGEAGWLIGVDWMDARVPGLPAEMAPSTGTVIPRVVIQGRVHHESETDHDRLRHEIVSGMADGVKGYVREGSSDLHEDPISKTIF